MRRRRLLGMTLVSLAMVAGAWSVAPSPVRADGGCTLGCCNYTVDCGSPFTWRCCLPGYGMAPCEQVCPNYCIEGQSCTGM